MDYRPQGRETGPGFSGGGGGPGYAANNDDLTNAVFSEAIQEDANRYFQRIYLYNNPLSVKEFLLTMKNLSNSQNANEKELLACLLKNLFDEFRFFSEYPEKELRTTAQVYGGIIRDRIVSNMKFATAIRKIMEALQSPRGSLLNTFGIVALNECRACLHKYPKICESVATQEVFNTFDDDLREYIRFGIHGQLPPNHVAQSEIQAINENARFTPPINQQSTTPLAGTGMRFAPRNNMGQSLGVTNADTLLQATRAEGREIESPKNEVEEKISFLCNNLSLSNLPNKCDEMKLLMSQQVRDRFIPWLAQYIVIKRVTIETNFHNLYNKFLISLNDEQLDDAVRAETYRNINFLLRSDMRKAASNFSDRMLLKNLGYWLGYITIARDEPILYDDLNIKGILIDAFFRGQHELLYIVPFVTKILSSTTKSVIFSPKSTWIYGIIKVLAEIHGEPDLKLNLKFEIEVVCKELQIDLKEVETTGILKDTSRLPNLLAPRRGVDDPSPINSMGFPANHYNNRTPVDFSDPQKFQSALQAINASSHNQNANAAAMSYSQNAAHSAASSVFQPGHSTAPQPQSSTFLNGANNTYSSYMDEPDYVQFLSKLENNLSQIHVLQQVPQLKSICRNAIGYSVKEMAGGMADKAMSIAVVATEALIKKDFALNSDETQLRRAAQSLMRNMTRGLAMIYTKEPLKGSMENYLRQAMNSYNSQQGNANSDFAKTTDDLINFITEQSLDIATNYVIKCACEKATGEIDKQIKEEFNTRKLCRQECRQFKCDPSQIHLTAQLPIALRQASGMMDENAFRIYDDLSMVTVGDSNADNNADDNFRRPPMPYNERASSAMQNDVVNRLQNIQLSSAVQRPRPSSVEAPLAFLNGADLNAPSNRPSYFAPSVEVRQQLQQGEDYQAKAEHIMREWMQMCNQPELMRDPQQALGMVVNMMRDAGILVKDERITDFFKYCANICFDVAYRCLQHTNVPHLQAYRNRCYTTLDCYVKLTCLMVKYSSNNQNHHTKLNLLQRVLQIVTTALLEDHDHRKTEFIGMPYMRIILLMFIELTGDDASLNEIYGEVITSFLNVFLIIHPKRAPGFVYHWMEIIGHRVVLDRLFNGRCDIQRTSNVYGQFLLLHFRFLSPFLRATPLPKHINDIFKGTLRIIYVILHDFPDILCDYYLTLCDSIPPSAIQLRNIILSATPRSVGSQPEFFKQSFEEIQQLPLMNENPKLHRAMSEMVLPELRSRLDEYLRSREDVVFLSELSSILTDKPTQGCNYNIVILNAVVVHVGIRAIDNLREKDLPICMNNIAHTAYMDVFQNLAVSLCNQGRYLLFNAIVNQLRYPNSHTNYFSCVILYLFLQAHTSEVKEQITRIIFERSIAQRPHPWGLLYTFMELVRNPQYSFWKHEFSRCTPEIERYVSKILYVCNPRVMEERLNSLNRAPPSRLQ